MNEISALSDEERIRLLNLSFGRDRIMLLLLFDTGLQVEDLIEVRISDLDIINGSLAIQGKKMDLSILAIRELESYLNARPGQIYLFEGSCGKPVTEKWKRCVLEKLLYRLHSE